MRNTMLDIETLGTSPNAVIISIAAVQFDAAGIGKTFYRVVNPEEGIALGMEMDFSSVSWWMGQSKEAKEIFGEAKSGLKLSLIDLRDFLFDADTIWGNGPGFDNVILANACKRCNIADWPFRRDRCLRTLAWLFPEVEPPEQEGVSHNALDDAKWQATYASKVLKHIQELKEEVKI